MKTLTIILFFIVGINLCKAQDTTVQLSRSMLDKNLPKIFISNMDGWLFKAGNDTAWAKKTIETSSWKKLKPTELSVKMADKNGKVEGWFRIKIKLDSTFGEKPFGIKLATWAATDIYIDGKLLASYGSTGLNRMPYKDYNPFRLRRSVGVGMRFFLPMFGLLGFDYGIGLDRIQPGQSGLKGASRFTFMLGYEPE